MYFAGGDFNHDLKASEKDAENCESWAYPFPREELPEHFSFCLDNLSDSEKDALWDSARNADMEYVPGVTYTVTAWTDLLLPITLNAQNMKM